MVDVRETVANFIVQDEAPVKVFSSMRRESGDCTDPSIGPQHARKSP